MSKQRNLTDEFLREIAQEADRLAANGVWPAPALAATRGVSPRLIHSWLQKARARGIIDSPGKGAHPSWHRIRCEHCDGQGYTTRP